MNKHKTIIFLLLITLIGAFFRFYNLLWGATFYFHPDERNIASSVSQLHFPGQMNPHFFAYGSFPIYLIYFLGIIWNNLSSLISHLSSSSSVSFEQAILTSRFFSALLSTLLIPSIFFIAMKMKNQMAGVLAAIFTAIGVGVIQFAHFGTFEIWLALLSVWLFYLCLRLTENASVKNIALTGMLIGLLLAIKISSLVFLLFPLLALNSFLLNKKYIFIKYSLIVCIAFVTFVITSPFAILDFTAFISSIKYESSVALGTLPVFYTGQFLNTVPVVFQFLHIYPFLLNSLVTIIFVLSFIYLLFLNFKKPSPLYKLLAAFYLILLISQAILFAKWTRYMVPTLPFIYLIIAITVSDFIKILKKGGYYALGIILLISTIFTLSYFVAVYTQPDSRIEASLWAKENIPANSKILSEVYDLGITPFNPYFPHITLFNFYDEFIPALDNYDYIILPSQRIMKNRLKNPQQFRSGYKFYNSLFNGTLGFTKIYQTPCDIFCKITYMGDPVFALEETVNVFDRPTVFIFQKKIKN